MTSADLHTLTGAYALDALPEEQERAFHAHLNHCRSCTTEVREFRETAARLALAAAEIPPRSLHTGVMAALPAVRQLPPRVTGGRTVLPMSRRHIRRWQQRLPHLAAAACLAACGILGTWALHTQHAADEQRARAARAEQHAATLAAVLADPNSVTRTATLSGGGTATVVASSRQGEAAVFYSGLPVLPDGRVYQLWYGKNGTMRPAGLLTPQRATGSALLTGSPQGADAVGITTEPHGGSTSPTTTPLALLSL
ncbi:anti-sigma factor domain-containing protein [Streptomyces sp. NPDC002574]|uniref:anti-sigma factor n=1 Tax=Streptomyces sp. NPDC002574 TaxID=3364652 RepID=UPI0036796CC8